MQSSSICLQLDFRIIFSIQLDLATVEKFCFHFSRALGSVVDYDNVNPSVWRVNYTMSDVQSMCALTKVDNVSKRRFKAGCFSGKLLQPFLMKKCLLVMDRYNISSRHIICLVVYSGDPL